MDFVYISVLFHSSYLAKIRTDIYAAKALCMEGERNADSRKIFSSRSGLVSNYFSYKIRDN